MTDDLQHYMEATSRMRARAEAAEKEAERAWNDSKIVSRLADQHATTIARVREWAEDRPGMKFRHPAYKRDLLDILNSEGD